MATVPTHMQLVPARGSSQFLLGYRIETARNPVVGNNYMYTAGCRRVFCSYMPMQPVTGARVLVDYAPFNFTINKSGIRTYTDVEQATYIFEVFDSAGTLLGSAGAVVGARAVISHHITGLSSTNSSYYRLSLTAGSAPKLYSFHAHETALTVLP